jgi:hypothetical protein
VKLREIELGERYRYNSEGENPIFKVHPTFRTKDKAMWIKNYKYSMLIN